MEKQNLIKISKFLFRVLNKEPELIGIKLSKDGWTEINDLIRLSVEYQLKNNYEQLTDEILEEIVANPTDGIQRFEISDDGWSIRVNSNCINLIKEKNKNNAEYPDYLYYVCEPNVPALTRGLRSKDFETLFLWTNPIDAWNAVSKNSKCNSLYQIDAKKMIENEQDHVIENELIKVNEKLYISSQIFPEYISLICSKK